MLLISAKDSDHLQIHGQTFFLIRPHVPSICSAVGNKEKTSYPLSKAVCLADSLNLC
jgi:hypothetical protein